MAVPHHLSLCTVKRLLLGCHDVGVLLQVERMAADSRFSLRLQRPSGPQGHLPLPHVSYTHTALPLFPFPWSSFPCRPILQSCATVLIKSVTAYKHSVTMHTEFFSICCRLLIDQCPPVLVRKVRCVLQKPTLLW